LPSRGASGPGDALPDELDDEAIRDRCRGLVLALARRYLAERGDSIAQDPGLAGEEPVTTSEIRDRLIEVLGPKYGKLVVDWLDNQHEVPDPEALSGFVTTVVEAAAVDGGREPLLWRIQRAIRRFVRWISRDQNEQAPAQI
jgi:hypothetical protein